MRKINTLRLFSWLLLVPGAIFNILAYYSLAPVQIMGIFLAATLVLLKLLDWRGEDERTAVLLAFAVCWFWAGISAIYLKHISPGAWGPDGPRFYETVTGDEVAFEDGVALIEYAGAVVMWRAIYDFFFLLGFAKAEYIGVTVNVAFVSLTAMLGVKMVKAIFGPDQARIRRFTITFASCGMFWLFAAIHIRDAMVLFFVTVLFLCWVYYFAQPSVKNTVQLVVATIAGVILFKFLRDDFTFVPIAMLMAGIAANIVGSRETVRNKKMLFVAFLVILPIAGVLLYLSWDNLMLRLISGGERYGKVSLLEGGSDSLGNQLIVTAPFPVKMIFGPAYVVFSPIPFWVGFLMPSSYHLFKTFHVIFMYFVMPLFGLAVWRLALRKELRTPAILFLLFCVIGFVLSVAFTSMEGRHFGGFLVSLLVIAMLPDLREETDRNAYRNWLTVFFAGVFCVHLAWSVLKIFT